MTTFRLLTGNVVPLLVAANHHKAAVFPVDVSTNMIPIRLRLASAGW